MEQTAESELLARYARSRDAEAFRSLLERHRDMVFATSRRILGNVADAEDVAQDCFILLARNAGKLRAPIAGWLHRVAVRVSLNRLREKRSQRAREIRAAERRREHGAPSWEELQSAVDEAITRLPERLRVPIILYYLEERKQEEIAAELAVSQAEVSRRIQKGVEALRRHMKRSGFAVPAVALAAMLGIHAAEGSPASLVASLGKLALSGTTAHTSAAAIGVIGGASVMKIGIVTAVAASAILAGGVAVQNIKAQAAAKSEIRVASIQGNPKSKIQNPKSELPTADDIFAEMSRRAQAVKGLKVTLDVRSPVMKVATSSRRVFEFLAPDWLRCEVPDWPETLSRDTSPAISVVKPKERWTYFPNRDEVADGLVPWGGHFSIGPWSWLERLLAAQLAPAAFYGDCTKRRVFRDKLNGRDCYIVSLSGPGKRQERLWIDCERWAALRLQGDLWSREGVQDHKDIWAQGLKEAAPGLWLPTVIVENDGQHFAQAACEALSVGDIPPERFKLPTDKPYFVRPADLEESGPRVDAADRLKPDTYGYVAAMRAVNAYPSTFEGEKVVANLKEFIAKNPRIRAGYYEILDARWRGSPAVQAEALALGKSAKALWPDDTTLKWTLFWSEKDTAAKLQMAQELAPALPADEGLFMLLPAQIAAKMHAEARQTADKLIAFWATKEVKGELWIRLVRHAATAGGWADELQKECERRADAQPPSEAHLLLLSAFEPKEDDEAARMAFLYHLADMAARKGGSAKVALDCVLKLSPLVWRHGQQIQDEGERARYSVEENAPRIAHIFSCVLDNLSEQEYAFRAQAVLVCEHWASEWDNSSADTYKKSEDAIAALFLKELGPDKPTSKAQQLWRYRVLGSMWNIEGLHSAGYDELGAHAVPFLEKAIALAPDDDDLKLKLAQTLAKAGRAQEAEEVFASLFRDHPSRPEVWGSYLTCAVSAHHMKNNKGQFSYAQMSDAVDKLLACTPGDSSVNRTVAEAYAQLGRLDDLLLYMDKRADASSNDVRSLSQALDQAAETFVERDDADGAARAWAEAMRWTVVQDASYQSDRYMLGSLRRVFDGLVHVSRRKGKGRDWIEKRWIPALQKMAERYDKDGTSAQRAVLRYALATAYQAMGNAPETWNQVHAAMKLWTWPNQETNGEWIADFMSSLPPEPADPAAELQKLLESGKVVWRKEDPSDKNLVWVCFEDHMTGFNQTTAKLVQFDFDMRPYTTGGVAFAEDRVYVGTDKGIVVYSRRDGFWYRLAVGGVLVDAPVTEIELTKDGELRVTIAEKDQPPRSFTFTPKSGKWAERFDPSRSAGASGTPE